MLEADEYPFREDRRNRKSRTASMEIESANCGPSNAEKAGNSEGIVPARTEE
ncbi:hypothetical protein PIB30_055321 [Stylosanthes scabra]|uniref:Uncharacterized protein n=1 Tax=Stylosanthes scabra TaxID=79078 RepID=A0ABU6SJM1_9FABA|nr:hypothetical protein [Stylosanthes scabra]